ncbi:hypothetical protein [Actinokineospora iranica]|uniref:Uncharacterized protein n=1 Tax=Actinokineospora iranica TaxID=1271860 RepID=A0A1G6Y476_9PSEU|nr:hypothetical protein [Actinokineospora iranica]SDD85294.1 hypothetical protein SAMN05216174_12019 [Actinokineospora iranica]
MTQVAAGKGSWSGVALPVRVHDLLIALAGRLDDDALADARELVASAEVDRALELIAGCLAAGPVAVGAAERDELLALFAAAHCDPAVVARLTVAEPSLVTAHRFAGGKVDGVGAEQGIAEAADRVIAALPDIRAVWAVWRLTPSGAATGAVPHRVVLIGVGPSGSAPATAYRVEHALRRAGITASVEVLRDGAEPTDYHHTAMRYATEVPVSRKKPAPVSPPPMPPPAPAPPGSGTKPEVQLTAPVAKPSRAKRRTADSKSATADPQPPTWTPDAPAPQPDESLNDQELGLLRQLQEELARREQTDPAHPGWQGDLESSGTPPFDWQEAGGPTMVNGTPLPPPDKRTKN